MRENLESLTEGRRFSGSSMFQTISDFLDENDGLEELVNELVGKFDNRTLFNYIIKSIARNVFFIELVNDDISTTIMEVRWTQKPSAGKKQEQFDSTDPRYCTYDNCLEIFINLMRSLNTAINDQNKIRFLELYKNYSVLPYEIPLDYKEITDGEIHTNENMYWYWGNRYNKIMKFRAVILNPSTNRSSNIFSTILKDKIKVKTYLTDRVQTGHHKTNREKRWECHPESVHFALRRNCQLIEYELLCQLCKFQGFPTLLHLKLVDDEIISNDNEIFRCPVTLEHLSYTKLRQETSNMTHGKSNFQIGHLNPLKAISRSKKGHNKNNISWISSDGNRIQGHLSLDKTRELLEKIQNNYIENQ